MANFAELEIKFNSVYTEQTSVPKSQPMNKKYIPPPAQDQGALCVCL